MTMLSYSANGLIEIDALLMPKKKGQIMLTMKGKTVAATLAQLQELSHELNIAQQWVDHHDKTN